MGKEPQQVTTTARRVRHHGLVGKNLECVPDQRLERFERHWSQLVTTAVYDRPLVLAAVAAGETGEQGRLADPDFSCHHDRDRGTIDDLIGHAGEFTKWALASDTCGHAFEIAVHQRCEHATLWISLARIGFCREGQGSVPPLEYLLFDEPQSL